MRQRHRRAFGTAGRYPRKPSAPPASDDEASFPIFPIYFALEGFKWFLWIEAIARERHDALEPFAALPMGQAILDLIKHPTDRQNVIAGLLQIALNYAGRRPHLLDEILVNVPIVMPLMRFTSR